MCMYYVTYSLLFSTCLVEYPQLANKWMARLTPASFQPLFRDQFASSFMDADTQKVSANLVVTYLSCINAEYRVHAQ